MKSINTEDFFKLVAIKSGIADLETVKRIYYGMIRALSGELRNKHIVKMPDWGELTLKIYKSRNAFNVNTKKVEPLPPRLLLKLDPDYKVRRYFYSLLDTGLE